MVYIYRGVLLGHKEESHYIICALQALEAFTPLEKAIN
jgi:hypothetical protein